MRSSLKKQVPRIITAEVLKHPEVQVFHEISLIDSADYTEVRYDVQAGQMLYLMDRINRLILGIRQNRNNQEFDKW